MIFEFKGGHSWLSNFESCKITLAGIEYPSVEHAFMSAKSNDKKWKEFCADKNNLAETVKKKSYEIELVDGWNELKFTIMRMCLIQKYNTEPFKSKLMATGSQNIQEGNYFGDKIWGVDLKNSPNVGENHLGRMIMEIRAKLLTEKELEVKLPKERMDIISETEIIFNTVSTLVKNLVKSQEECVKEIFLDKEKMSHLFNSVSKSSEYETEMAIKELCEIVDAHNSEMTKDLVQYTLSDNDILLIEKCFLEKYSIGEVDESEYIMAQAVMKFINLLTLVHRTLKEKELFYLSILEN